MASLDLEAKRSGSTVLCSELAIGNDERPIGSELGPASGVGSPACKPACWCQREIIFLEETKRKRKRRRSAKVSTICNHDHIPAVQSLGLDSDSATGPQPTYADLASRPLFAPNTAPRNSYRPSGREISGPGYSGLRPSGYPSDLHIRSR